jgi:hypothetical protein
MSNIMLKNVRLSFPKVFEHGSFGGESTGKYEATFLLPKSDEATYKKIMSAITETKGKTKIPSDKLCIKDGDETDDEHAIGHWIIKTANKNRPTLIDRNRNPVTKEDNEANPMFFGGATVNASISFWKQDNSYGKRVNGNLAGIQYVSGDIHTDGFSDTGTADVDEFEAFDDDEDL